MAPAIGTRYTAAVHSQPTPERSIVNESVFPSSGKRAYATSPYPSSCAAASAAAAKVAPEGTAAAFCFAALAVATTASAAACSEQE